MMRRGLMAFWATFVIFTSDRVPHHHHPPCRKHHHHRACHKRGHHTGHGSPGGQPGGGAILHPPMIGGPAIGVEDEPTFVLGSNDSGNAYAKAAGIKASWMHITVRWNHPFAPRAYASAQAHAHGMKVEATLTGQRVDMPATAAQYGAWCRQAATSVPAEAYSMWNEPDLYDWWPRSVVEYRAYYMACRAAVKLVRPQAQVWAGETSSGGAAWIKSLLASGGMPPADGYAHHPYHWSDYSRPMPSDYLGIENLAALRKLIGGMPLYLTEFGYFASDPGRSWLPCRAVTEAGAAGVRVLVWNMLYPQPGHVWNTAMLNGDGTPTPEYNALQGCL